MDKEHLNELIDLYCNTFKTFVSVNNELLTLPEGWIEKTCKGNREYYCYRFRVNGKRMTKPVKNMEELEKVLRRRRSLKKQKKDLEELLTGYEKSLSSFHEDPEQLKNSVYQSLQQREEKEKRYNQELAKVQSKKHSENYRMRTIKGDLVASKSEMMIADALARENLSYEYEKEMQFTEGILHPDFTIQHCGKIYIWEHLGLYEKVTYREQWNWKKKVYEKNNFIENINLIVTYETKENPLDQEKINHMIAKYFI